MGQETGIEWTSHSWSPWRGCTKVSPGCANCYAEALSLRNPKVLGEWGPNGTRVVGADSYWKQLTRWNREAKAAGERRRVFPSLCDPFEDRDELIGPRNQFFSAMHTTPDLIWLLLTKRPENILRLWPKSYLPADHPSWEGRIWLGTSVEDQQRADERIPELLKIPAAIRFLSVEPLLGPVDLARSMPCGYYCDESVGHVDHPFAPESGTRTGGGISWVIIGGESGPGARPCDLAWIRSIVKQCKAAGTPTFVKQLGSVSVGYWLDPDAPGDGICHHSPDRGWKLKDKKGGDIEEFPHDLRIREFPK